MHSHIVGLTSIEVTDNVTTINDYAFWGSALKELSIGENVQSILLHAVWNCSNKETVILNSAKIASSITSVNDCARLIEYAKIIYIKDDITTIGEYITSNFSVVENDKDGYIKYTIN